MKKSTLIGISILSVCILLSMSIIPSAQSSMVKDEIKYSIESNLFKVVNYNNDIINRIFKLNSNLLNNLLIMILTFLISVIDIIAKIPMIILYFDYMLVIVFELLDYMTRNTIIHPFVNIISNIISQIFYFLRSLSILIVLPLYEIISLLEDLIDILEDSLESTITKPIP